MRHSAAFTITFFLFLATAARADAAVPTPQATAAKVDDLLLSEIFAGKRQNLSPKVDDETFLRRITLDLIGELPTPGEITEFTFDPDEAKYSNAIARLLANKLYGRNWARYWRDVILYRRSEDRALLSAGPVEKYLEEQFNTNVPWNKVARSFITAKGSIRDDGSTALIMAQQGRPDETVAEISRIFMGIQIQCAQCHDHKTDRWTREQFHELVAFFPRVAVRRDGQKKPPMFNVVADDGPAFRRANQANRFRGTPEHYMPDLEKPTAKGTLMKPKFFLTGKQLPLGTRDQDRRDQLATWITTDDNVWFANAYINRMWSELIGEGFFEPVDDMGPDRKPNAPKALATLAGAFVESGYDTKWLITTIMSTEAYQRQSRDRRKGNEKPFAANCPQRLRGDQLFNALTTALGIPEGGNASSYLAASRGPRAQFNAGFGYDPSFDRTEVRTSIPQALAMMNSPLISRFMTAAPNTALGKLLAEIKNDEAAIVELYLRCLAREPTDKELKTCLAYRKEVTSRNEAFEDLLWSLINSTEFLHRR